MKTDSITIATTNSDKHLNKLSKELLFDICRQINNDPKPIYINNTKIGETAHAKVKVGNRLSVQMDLTEPMAIKGKKCFFIPAFDGAISENKNGFEIVQEAKLIGICMVKEHHDKSIKPTIFEYTIGTDYFVFDAEFIGKDIIETFKEVNKPVYIFYPGAKWSEEACKNNAREKGMMHEKLDQSIQPFSICHDPPEKTLTEFKNKIETDIKHGQIDL